MSDCANMRRRISVGIAMGIALALALGRETSAAEKEVSPYIGPAAAFRDKQTLEEKLKTNIDMNLVETPLKDVVALLQEVISTSVVLSAKRIEEAGVAVDTPVTFQVKGMRLSTALRLLTSGVELAYVDRDQYLLITSPEACEDGVLTRVYDVRELLALPAPLGGSNNGKSSAASANPPAAISGSPASISPASVMPQFGGGMPAAAVCGDLAPQPTDELVDLITSAVAPQSWNEVGGPGSINDFKGLLVITQTLGVHEKVEQLLTMLHEATGLPNKTVKVFR